jgi:non-ribosomal peptide synthetase component F
MALAAIYQVLLTRWSGQQDIAIGISVPGRRRRELEGLIGLFANHLVLRTQVVPQESFRMLLRRVRQTALGAHAHQDLPFEELIQELGSERNLSRHPVFQVALSLRSESDRRDAWTDLTVGRMALEPSTSQLDLSLDLLETQAGLSGALEYALDLFERDTIESLARAFQVLLQAVVTRPDTAVGELPLLETAVCGRRAAEDRVKAPVAEVPVAEVSQVARQYVAPRTPVEQQLARIWSEVLQVRRVGVHDNFFELGGGHSLLAMQMVARVREIFEVEIPIGVLFQAADIEKLAARVVAAARSN